MAANAGAPEQSGQNPAENCPDHLDLETGVPDDDRAQLYPGHPLFDLFAFAWRWQDRWSLTEHADFWRAALLLWPHRGGGERVRERLAWAIRAARHRGLSDDEAAAQLGYQRDSLRRMNVLSLADPEDHRDGAPGLPTWAVTDYVLPRVYGPGDREPSSAAYPNVIAEPDEVSPYTAQLAVALAHRDGR